MHPEILKWKQWLVSSYLKRVGDEVVSALENNNEPDAEDVKNTMIGLLGSLQAAKRDWRSNLITRAQLTEVETDIRDKMTQLVDEIKDEWLHKTPAKKQKSGNSTLDDVFKSLILVIGVLSIAMLIYTMFFHSKSEEKTPFMVLSTLMGSIAFYGYGRWRLIELGNFSNSTI